MSWKPIGFQLFEDQAGKVMYYVVYETAQEFPEMGLVSLEGYRYPYTGEGQKLAQMMVEALNTLREASK